MSKLLYIQASPRGERSYCIRAADAFIEAYKKAHPDDQIVTLNVFDENIPAFDGFTVQAKYAVMHDEEHSKDQLQAWKKVEQLIEQFTSADKYVLAVRVEGWDRKSFFAIAESDNGVDGFRFRKRPIHMRENRDPDVNVYDMRLTAHAAGWISGIFCTDRKEVFAEPGTAHTT